MDADGTDLVRQEGDWGLRVDHADDCDCDSKSSSLNDSCIHGPSAFVALGPTHKLSTE